MDYLYSLGLRHFDGVWIQSEPAPNTALQAAWIVDQIENLNIHDLALVVSPYHMPRVYLTVLKAMNRRGVRVPVIPAPVAVPPDRTVPESGGTAHDLLPGEVHRILKYIDEGWVATPEELRHYLGWLWRHRQSELVRKPA